MVVPPGTSELWTLISVSTIPISTYGAPGSRSGLRRRTIDPAKTQTQSRRAGSRPGTLNNMTEKKYGNKHLTIVQLNTGRNGPVCDTVLAEAHENGVDVVCVQEPWAGESEDGHRLTKSHPGYKKYLPLGEGRPKAAVYVARGVKVYQKPLPLTTTVRVVVRGVEVFNVYRESKDTYTLPEV